MKLKNFIREPKKGQVKGRKTFHTKNKFNKKSSRVDEREKTKKNKRSVVIIILGTSIFVIAVILSGLAYFYNSFVLPRVDRGEILLPGEQFVIEMDKARNTLEGQGISIKSFGYSSESGALTLVIDDNQAVYFSDTANFSEQVNLLIEIRNNLRSQDRNAKIIDLRYNRPIVKF